MGRVIPPNQRGMPRSEFSLVKHDRSRHRSLLPSGKKDPSYLALDYIVFWPVGNQTIQRHALVLRSREGCATRVKTMGRLGTERHS